MKSSERTLEILEHLAAVVDRPTLGELARDLELPKSSLHGILRTMQDKGWIQTDPSGTRFGLGVRSLLVGASYVDSDDVVAMTADALDELSEDVGEAIHLGRLDRTDIVYLAKRESRHPLRLFSAIGRRLPAYATALGKAVLSQQPEDALDELLPSHLSSLTKYTIVDRDQLREELERIRECGYAIDNQENTEGIRCFAVPLRRGQHLSDAISCSVPIIRITPETETHVVEALRRAQAHAEARLG